MLALDPSRPGLGIELNQATLKEHGFAIEIPRRAGAGDAESPSL
jgi:hypothetical protein